MAKLEWQWNSDGQWEANSSITDEGDAFLWRIAVCNDGTFCVNESSRELTVRAETFDSLRDAKSWCVEEECRAVVNCEWFANTMQKRQVTTPEINPNMNGQEMVTFVRSDGGYMVPYPIGYENWDADVAKNPGTTRIVNASGAVLWEQSLIENDDEAE